MDVQLLPASKVPIQNVLNVPLTWNGAAFSTAIVIVQPRVIALKNGVTAAAMTVPAVYQQRWFVLCRLGGVRHRVNRL